MPNTANIRSKIKSRLKNECDTFFAVVGPCSISCEKEALIFGKKLFQLQKQLGDKITLVMRAFVEKSRTSHAWRGFVYQPDLNGDENIREGLRRTKNLFSALEVPLCMEFIEPAIYHHLEPYISWGFIGARTATSAPHRILASNSPIPFGFKHSLDGDVLTSINAIKTAQNPHCILTEDGQIHSPGNPYTHVVLRGGKTPNYDRKSVTLAKDLSEQNNIKTPILVDCSHGNSVNKPDDQKNVFLNVLEQYLNNPKNILGIMMESNIYKGASKETKEFGISFTDPCLDFEETSALLLFAKQQISQRRHKEGLDQPTFCAYNH